jgi:formate hydrogenlyase transcriptional activator
MPATAPSTLEQEALARYQALLGASRVLAGHRTLGELLNVLSNQLHVVVPFDFLCLILHDAASDEMRLVVLEPADAPSPPFRALPVSNGGPAAIAWQTQRAAVIPLAPVGELHPTLEFIRQHGRKVTCWLPLTTSHERLGVLGFGSSDAHDYPPETIAFMEQVAAIVAIAVDNTINFERAQEYAAALRTERDQLQEQSRYLEDEFRVERGFGEVVGGSASLRGVLKAGKVVAPTDSTVLLLGETGTGKELLARAIHNLSPRRKRPFIRLSGAAFPSGLLESELFGHEKGSFTGATMTRMGRLELAHEGTLFLDEVGDIPIDLQPKLLRVLQEREFERLGSSLTRRVDIRLIAATNRDLSRMIEDGLFRQDLYYRLNVFPIRIPPLRERREDIPVLAEYFAAKHARRMGRPVPRLSQTTRETLQQGDWPGNIRELENVIERAVIVSGPELKITADDVHSRARRGRPSFGRPTMRDAERSTILRALKESGGIIGGPTGAAARLGLKRTTLQSMMHRLGIKRPSF